MKCPHCGSETNVWESDYCPRCGKTFSQKNVEITTRSVSASKMKSFFISLVGGLIPIVIFTTIAMTQYIGTCCYSTLGEIIVIIQLFYVILLLPITMLFFILRKKKIALGLLVSFVIGGFVAFCVLGKGI